ncbi:MAG: efflux RND transporter periplasmic adaptor subunit [Bacteroidales bacterium]|jgi:RND family efflux transporter MFP subunit|nr:efflux RND transporter periplasmic adaptor subunit [Bacteroidales bacterium]
MKTLVKTITVFSVTLLVTSCGGRNVTEDSDNSEEMIKVRVVDVSARDIDQKGTFNATVQAEVTNNIAPQTSVRIKKVYAEVGDHVKAGQKLVDMDAVNLNQAKLQMENDRQEFERVDRLYQVGGTSKSNWDKQKLAYDLSRQSYENLMENTSLVSPIDGIITQRNYDNGDMFSMGAPIYIVEQIRPVKIIVGVSESLYTRVKKGMNVEIQLDVYGDEVFKGTVKLVYPSIDPDTHTFLVEVQISNSDERVRPGMFARVTFNYGSENRVIVPDRAVSKQSGSADRYVYVINNGVAEYRKVELGQRIGTEFEVLDGLTDGEIVAITGQSRLNTGTRVEIVDETPENLTASHYNN